MKIVEFVKSHPVESGLGIVAVLAVLFLLTRGGGGSSSSGDSGAAAYYAAQAQQSNNSAAIQIAQDNDVAQTAQTQIAANVSTTNNTTWANVQSASITDQYNLATLQSNNDLLTQYSNERIAANDINYDNAVLTQQTILGNEGKLGAAATLGSAYLNTGFNAAH